MLGLQDRVAIVTRATRGIGFETAKASQELGVPVAVLQRDEGAHSRHVGNIVAN
jgi:NAD(P)-dependent dehydrogenase (short-subunit alcohol dehydrogenase family)